MIYQKSARGFTMDLNKILPYFARSSVFFLENIMLKKDIVKEIIENKLIKDVVDIVLKFLINDPSEFKYKNTFIKCKSD